MPHFVPARRQADVRASAGVAPCSRASMMPALKVSPAPRVSTTRGGGDEPAAFLRDMHLLAPHTDLVLAWGEAGAFALGRDGGLVQSPAFPPPRVVDTL